MGAALLLFGACSAGRAAATPASRAVAAPTFELADVRDGQPSVSFRSGRATVVNFFAAWCDECRKELPALSEAARRSPSVAFIGVDEADSRSNAVDLLASAHVAYPAGYDPDKTIAHRFNVGGIPTTFFIRADGTISSVVRGPVGSAELGRRMRDLVGSV